MGEIIMPMLPIDRAEQMRREIAAMLFFATPRKDATEAEKVEAYQRRVRGLLHLLDILNGIAKPEETQCEGCGKTLTPETPRLVCDDGPELCYDCAPPEHPADSYGYRADDADADIARARAFADEMTGEPVS